MAKILILANHDLGLYKFRKELIQELINRGNDIYISLPNGKMVEVMVSMGCEFIDTKVDRRGLNPIKDIKLLLSYWKLFEKVKPDMVITYTIKPNIYGGMVSAFKKVPYAINITGLGTAFQNNGILKKIITFLYTISCNKAKVLFFENEENRNIFIKSKIISEERTCTLKGAGVNLEEYKFYELPTEDKNINFLYIGRVMKEKGINELFEAAERIKSEYENVNFKIVGPLEEDYKETIKSLEERNIIKFYGFQKDVQPFIKGAHCFVLPSHHEGMANTLLECGAMGRPLVTSNINGCKEAVVEGKNGYLVDVKNSDDLYKKIKKFMELPYKEKVSMGRFSHEYISDVFDKRKVVETTIRGLEI